MFSSFAKIISCGTDSLCNSAFDSPGQELSSLVTKSESSS